MKVYKSFFVMFVFIFTLCIFVTEVYSYTITASAGAGGTISPVGAVPVTAGADQTFTITPDPDYGVSGVILDYVVSAGPVSSYTFTNVTADHSITVSFICNNPPVKLENDGSLYSTIMEAYNYASIDLGLNNFTLKIIAGTLPEEDLYFDQNVSVVLEGGHDCFFGSNSMVTKIPGSLTITSGTVIPSNLVVSSPPPCELGDYNNFPGNPEICDGLDNNCNGLVDDGLTFDADVDGATSIGSCEGSADDCDDNKPSSFPGNPEICDGSDNNCDGQIDEGFVFTDADGDGYSSIASCGGSADDCNDNNASINPGAIEIPNDGIDQDCNGQDLTFPETTECTECHGSVNSIKSRHANVKTPNNDPTCAGCHSASVSNVLHGHYGQTVRTAGNNMPAGSLIDCFSCHDLHDPNEYDFGGAEIVWPKVQAVGYANVTCDTCHANRAAVHATGMAHNNRVIDSSCGQCHTSDTTNLGSPGSGTLVSAVDVDTLHRSDCTLCHNYAGTNIAAGTVRQAIQDGMAGIHITCLDCHSDKTTGHGSVDHVALGYVTLGATICANCHDPGGAANATVAVTHYGNCVLCHTTVPNLQPGIPAGGGDCTVCHGNYFSSHSHHNGIYNDVSYNSAFDTSHASQQGCTVCHHDYDTVNDTSLGLSTWATILVEHDRDGTKDGSTNTCDNCHAYGGGSSVPLTDVQNAIASGNPATCATCHTDKVPDVDHGVPASGKHPQHFDRAGFSCEFCHQYPVIENIPNFNSGTDLNGNSLYDLSETDLCYICHQDGSGNAAPDDFKLGWSNPNFVLACNGCHEIPPAIGSHLAHYDGVDTTLEYGDLRITEDFTLGQMSATNMIGCGNCHPMDSRSHGNGVWGDVELANITAPANSLKALSANSSYDQGTGTCSNIYCHSMNSSTTDGIVPMSWPEASGWDPNIDPLPRPLPANIITERVYKDVTWNSGERLTCNGCHANPPQTSSVDNDGGAGDSHYWVDPYGYENLHVYNMSFEPIGCRTCHYDTVQAWDETQGQGWDIDPVTNRRFYYDVALYDKAKHVNGSVDVTFDTVNNFTYFSLWSGTTTPIDLSPASFDPATKTCSNVECHIQETEVTWGLPFRWWENTECDRCHVYSAQPFGPICSDCHGSP